ncbi:MAG: PHP domain-containing protein [Solirubrobacteraceae bacterium]
MTSDAEGRPTFDLQAHSQHSDGALEPAEVVERAQAAGVELFALTDHDTVAGVEEALSAGRECGIAVVPAVELSAIHGEREDLHILGYGVDHRQDALLSALKEYRADREARAERMAQALTELGLHLDDELLDSRRRSGSSLGRPHLARAVLEDRRNATRLAEEGLEQPERILQAYLLPGKPAYRGRTKPGVKEALDVIHAAGGVAVWAHPFWDIENPEDVLATLEQFVADGLDGVESFYLTHDLAQTQLLDHATRRLGLLSTGSSDFHGPDHAIFSRFRAFPLYGLQPRLGTIAAPSPA